MRANRLFAAAALAACATSCSFIVGSGFTECTKDTECASDKVCLKQYCIPMPEACRREVGAFDDPQRIAIAAALPLSSGGLPDAGGAMDDSEVSGLIAMNLAVEEANVRRVNGRQIGFYVCNTGRDKARLRAQVAWLADELGARAVLFSGSSQGIAAHEEAKARDVLLMSATATSPELISVHQTSGLLWRTAPPDSLQGKVLADFLTTDTAYSGVTRVSVVYVDDAYGQGLKAVIQDRLTTAGRTVRSFPYTEGADVTGVVAALESSAPQVTVLVAFATEARQILKLAATRPALTGAHRWMFTDSAKDPAILDDGALPQVQNSFGFAPAQGAGKGFAAFRDRFLTRFLIDPSTYSFTSHSYDAMYVTVLAHAYATRPGATLTGTTLADGILSMSKGASYTLAPENLSGMLNAMSAGTSIDLDGASGKLDFNPDAGAPGSPIERWQIMPDAGFETRDLTEPPLTL